MSAIAFSAVSKAYDRKVILQDFSLVVAAGERVVIAGPSGCGKTTVLRLAAGFIAPDLGSISMSRQVVAMEGQIIWPPERRNLGMVFQDLALWPHLTVGGNLEFGLKAQRVAHSEREDRITQMLELVQMRAYRHSRPAELSGGQQQRVALARALVSRPKLLLMDEPLSSLDEALNKHLRHELLLLHRKLGFTLIYVTHDRAEAYEVGDRIVSLRDGRIDRIEPSSPS